MSPMYTQVPRLTGYSEANQGGTGGRSPRASIRPFHLAICRSGLCRRLEDGQRGEIVGSFCGNLLENLRSNMRENLLEVPGMLSGGCPAGCCQWCVGGGVHLETIGHLHGSFHTIRPAHCFGHPFKQAAIAALVVEHLVGVACHACRVCFREDETVDATLATTIRAGCVGCNVAPLAGTVPRGDNNCCHPR